MQLITITHNIINGTRKLNPTWPFYRQDKFQGVDYIIYQEISCTSERRLLQLEFSLGEQLVRSDSHSTKDKASTHSWKRLEDAMQILVNTTDKPVFNNDVLRSFRLAGMLTILARGWLASPSTGTVATHHTLSIEMCTIAHKLTNNTFTRGDFLECQRS